MKAAAILAAAILIAACAPDNGMTAMVTKAPGCSCCGGHASYLDGLGYDVEVTEDPGLDRMKDSLGIPANMRSCHTTMLEGYFIEGHVPQEAIDKLLEERPDIDGITLPGMPRGSPGMPGRPSGSLVIYAVTDGVAEEFLRT